MVEAAFVPVFVHFSFACSSCFPLKAKLYQCLRGICKLAARSAVVEGIDDQHLAHPRTDIAPHHDMDQNYLPQVAANSII